MKLNLTCEQSDIDAIDEAAMTVLSEKGIRMPYEPALEVFRKAGCRVEGEIVFFEPEMLRRTISQAPSKFTIRARDPKNDVVIGGGDSIVCTAYECISVVKDDEFWSAKSTDTVNFAKLAETSKQVNMVAPWVAEAHDLPEEQQSYFQYAATLKHVTKPIMGMNDGYEHSKRCISLLRDFYDNHNKEDHLTLGLISPVSPLGYDDRMLQAIFAYAEENQPLLIANYVMPGATGPITVAGAVVVAHSEVLAGIALSQLINPGNPVIYGNAAGSMDIRHLTSAIGTPEMGLIAVIAKNLAKKYGLPSRGGGSLSDAKRADVQAGIESTATIFPTILGGVDFILGGAGILDSFTIVGYEKFLLDEEAIAMARVVKAGPEVDEDHLALETILEVGHGGSYLGEDHTYEHMRDGLYMSDTMVRVGYLTWKDEGRRSAYQNIQDAVEKRLAEYVEPPLSEAQQALIAEYLDVTPKA